MANALLEVQKFGQSIWYDNIRRGLITSGELQTMIERDGLLGVTSNPAIFEKAIAGSADYDQATRALVGKGAGDAQKIYETLAIQDIQLAADILYPVYLRTDGRDGYVSFEVSPHLAHDTRATVAEARRLRDEIGRDNVMIKVPATPEGVPAIRELIADGINVNVTLLFALEVYEAVADAYMTGLEDLLARGRRPDRIASVASFFISRIDTLIDDRLGRALDASRDPERRARLKGLIGQVAIANARLTYARFRELCAGPRWKSLAEKEARPQRLLWASTSTKNPKFPPTIYVDSLIGLDTVNTLPAETFTLFRTEGRPRPSLTENWAESLEQACETMRTLAEIGISMKEVTGTLLEDGVRKFAEAFDKLLSAVERKRRAVLGGVVARQTHALGSEAKAVQAALEDWRVHGKVRRLWSGDPTLWTGRDESQWLGWLHIVHRQLEEVDPLMQAVQSARDGGFRHLLLLGMGGSSLCPDVMKRTFGATRGHPELQVLDSTVPAQVRAFEKRVDLERTLFIVSSKSGSTTEPNSFLRYFLERVRRTLGGDTPGSRFIAITDPGTKLHRLAKSERFRHIFHGVPSIGGRYSALSNFGVVPMALMGIDVKAFLDRAETMVHSCASCISPEDNPGVLLGAILGTLARRGRDKLTLVASPGIAGLGAWLEQLIAESTGKEGVGIVPVDGERIGPPEAYGEDRLFVYLRLSAAPASEQDAAVDALERAGQAVVRIQLEDAMDLGQEFFRWEIATAVAGAILGINAFDQPDVEASKIATRSLTEAYERTGRLPGEVPILEDAGIALFADSANAAAMASAARRRNAADYLAAHLGRLGTGDYFALNAYVEMNEQNHRLLQEIRHAVRDARRVATTLGYGPRFLHSTGQLHKGGPNTGVFLQITSEDAEDLPIAGQDYTFGILKQAQALGDFQVLAERGRRALRVHLGSDVVVGLEALRDIVRSIPA